MLSTVSLVAPIFALIGLGFAAVRWRWLDKTAARVLAEFGYKVAMPALLFRAMSSVGAPQTSPLSLLGAYFTCILTIWLLATAATRVVLRRPATDAPSVAMACCFGNGVMLGIPLILGTLGAEAMAPVAFLVTVETAFLWMLATWHMEIAARGAARGSVGVTAIARDVMCNPIVASIVLGLAWGAGGLPMPELLDKLLGLLAQAAIPVSLFALGMTVATFGVGGSLRTVALVCIVKLALYPMLALLLGLYVFGLPPTWAAALFLFTSMPVGANAFIFASRYERATASVSAAVAISTAIAVVSVTMMLGLLRLLGLAA